MIASFGGFAAVYAACAFTFPALRRRLHPLLILYGYMIAVILIEQSFVIMLANTQTIEPGEGWMPYAAIRLHGFLFVPAVVLWLAAMVLRPGSWTRWLYVVLGVALLTLGDYGLMRTGMLRMPGWHALGSLLLHTGIAAVSLAFLRWTASAFRKRGIAI